MSVTAPSPVIEVRGVSKSFPGVQALSNVELQLGQGEVLAVVGENGAGKSTLMKILAGVQAPDRGEVLVDGKPLKAFSVEHALDRGIALIHQELNLADNLDVAANIFLGREPHRFGLIDRSRLHHEADHFLKLVGLDISPITLTSTLSIGQQQMVEIAKAISVDARVLIMDEPTSSLSHRETEALFAVVRDLKRRGVSILYISHRLGEVKELADRVVVLRDGHNAGELQRDEISHDRIVRLMVGRDVSQFYDHRSHPAGDVMLDVDRLVTSAHPGESVCFQIRAGEVVGMAGLVGAGRTEILESIFGISPSLGGRVRIAGREVSRPSPQESVANGLGLVPEDRKQQGLILSMAVQQNLSLVNLFARVAAGCLVHRRYARELAGQIMDRLRIKTANARQIVRDLSGGNQQKVVLGKWLAIGPRVLLLDEPTRGVDVGAKHEIYRLIEDLAESGVAILFVSSEMEEILGLSDRTLVLHEGRITGELTRAQLSEEAVMQLATGAAGQTAMPAFGEIRSQTSPAENE